MKIAFAGFRHGHIFCLYHKAVENAEIIGCYEEDATERKNTEETLGIKFCYNSYEELISDSRVEAVAIGDYYGKRGKMVIDALKSGKHVICDKPICTSLEELDEIERLARENNLKVCCMLDLRYMPQVEKVKEIIQSGKLGKIHVVSFTGQHCLNYGIRPSWYFEEEKHGGTINDIAIHGVDLVRYITGKNLSDVNFARTWNAFADKEPDFKDCAQFNVLMDDMAVSGDVSYAAPAGAIPTYWDFYFWGTEGMLKFNYMDSKIYLYTGEENVIECEPPKSDYMLDFIAECNGEKTIMDTEDVLKSQRQVLMIQKSADEY